MVSLDRGIKDKLIAYAKQDEDIDLKALAMAGLHYSQYQNPEIQLFLTEQLEKMNEIEESVRHRWGLILDYFGTVFYLIGDRPRAIECYELAKEVLPDDDQIAENLRKAKT
jgi:tetratricopeptide (TPR) repeat protein